MFIATSRFKQPHYANEAAALFAVPTGYTPLLIRKAMAALGSIYRPRHRYIKVGIMLTGLVPDDPRQPDLFLPEAAREPALMATVDRINAAGDGHALFWAAEGIDQSWQMRRRRLSRRYTTRWDELLTVRVS